MEGDVPPGALKGGRMYTQIMVPLDGSKLAEQALPYARTVATALKIPVLLLRVIENVADDIQDAGGRDFTDRMIDYHYDVRTSYVITGGATEPLVPLTPPDPETREARLERLKLGLRHGAQNYLEKIAEWVRERGAMASGIVEF